MKLIKSNFLLITGFLSISVFFASCEKDGPTATVSINETGSDLGGDVTGNGGSTSRTYTWNNPLTTVDWNMDITATIGGSFQLAIKDPDGSTMLDQTLTSGQGDDSKSGVSSAGTAGAWTIIINLTNFNGDGSFSISPGN